MAGRVGRRAESAWPIVVMLVAVASGCGGSATVTAVETPHESSIGSAPAGLLDKPTYLEKANAICRQLVVDGLELPDQPVFDPSGHDSATSKPGQFDAGFVVLLRRTRTQLQELVAVAPDREEATRLVAAYDLAITRTEGYVATGADRDDALYRYGLVDCVRKPLDQMQQAPAVS